MKNQFILYLTLLLFLGQVAQAQENQTFKNALQASKTTIDLRLRYETVDDVAFEKDAGAPTLRTTLHFQTGDYRGWSIFVQAESITAIGDDDGYRNAGAGSLSNRVTDRPVVADPELTEFNQVGLRYSQSNFNAHIGRREIAMGNQRILGPVGWRQNHQSFDSVSLGWKASDRVALTYHYLNRAHRIFGDSKKMRSHIARAEVDLGPDLDLAVYAALLDYEKIIDLGLSTQTLGIRLSGKHGDDWILDYTAEYAQQRDWADNPADIDANYGLVEIGVSKKTLKVGVGLEVLGGKQGEGRFSTPLATLHKFNGWADKFLATPLDGLEDLYVSLSGKYKAVGWSIIAHDFHANSLDRAYGSEIDLLGTWKPKGDWGLGAKAAFYDADTFSRDTDKIMAWATYKFSK